MDSLGNVIKMLFLLKKNGKIKIKDLSDELGVSDRQIRRYKTQIEKYFNIESTTGIEGGYILKDNYFPFKNILTESEINKLKLLVKYLNCENNIEVTKIVDKLNLKILNDSKNSLIIEETIHYSQPKIEFKTTEATYLKIREAIINKKEIIIKYSSNNGQISERRVRPHKLFLYKGEYYLVGTCLMRNDIRYFKLVRIKELIVTGFNFESDFDADKFLKEQEENNLGIYGGQTIRLELEVMPPMANTIKEREWVNNQEIIELENGKIRFIAKIKNGPEVISWILSMGEFVKIISPNLLRNAVKKKLKIMMKNFYIED
ncbi:WYL domain-containing protein [Clostridium sp. CH2]|uniref:helix-turn-helix transcriptional regulator n=1 Tax=Clostridium sp. CH2 TaxID=2949990 RepID=UPI00207A2C2F|nr:WYL domain-containing protein [Clostridium sp. CH2]